MISLEIYGYESREYMAALPDMKVWLSAYSCLHSFSKDYYKNYNDFPVVGITQVQAIDYSKWRTDRVFEKTLIDLKIIDWNSKQTRDDHFTTERFFNGQINRIKQLEINSFFEYTLPSAEEILLILNYHDSLEIVLAKEGKNSIITTT